MIEKKGNIREYEVVTVRKGDAIVHESDDVTHGIGTIYIYIQNPWVNFVCGSDIYRMKIGIIHFSI